jgi:hypothetical protein
MSRQAEIHTSPRVCLVFETQPAYRDRETRILTDGNGMSSSFIQGVAFFALSVIILVAAFGGFGVL